MTRHVICRSYEQDASFSTSHFQQPLIKGPDPYNYASGRWLRNDSLERQMRFVQFDFEALCRKILELCPDASSITSYEKLEGGFNRVFIFYTNNEKRIVARLPFSLVGPAKLMTNSEVATIKYLQAKTSIPIPKILDWSDDISNSIGSEYIIMEHAAGIPLHLKWPSMDVGQQISCIKAVYEKLQGVAKLQFPAYGSLYFANTPCITSHKLPLDADFAIGPHCRSSYWDCDAGQPRYYHAVDPHQGPWSDFLAYCDGLIDNGVARVPPVDNCTKRPRYHGSVQTHLELLEQGRKVIQKMAEDPRIQKTARPTMFHPDLHTRNIFVSEVDPTVITAIIDWQSCSIEPAFWYADDVPDFARPITDSSREDKIEPNSEACAGAHNASLQLLISDIAQPQLMDESFFRPFRYCYRTWAVGAVFFREELIQTSLRWEGLGLPGSCPYTLPSSEELAVHKKEFQFLKAGHEMKKEMSKWLDTRSDGWVPTEEYDETKSTQDKLFREFIKYISETEDHDNDEPIRNEADVRELWPFDIKN